MLGPEINTGLGAGPSIVVRCENLPPLVRSRSFDGSPVTSQIVSRDGTGRGGGRAEVGEVIRLRGVEPERISSGAMEGEAHLSRMTQGVVPSDIPTIW